MLVHRYIFKELARPTLLALFSIIALIFVVQLLRFGPQAVRIGISLGELLTLSALFVPPFLGLSVPLALTIGAFIAFARLSADGELQVLDSLGYGPGRLLPVPLAFAICGMLLSFYSGAYLAPRSVARLEQQALQIGLRTMTTGLKAGIFNQFDRNLTIYFRDRGEDAEFRQLVIYDGRTKKRPVLISASSASLKVLSQRGRIRFNLDRGEVHRLTSGRKTYQRISFQQMLYQMDFSALLKTRLKVGRKIDQLTPEQLRLALRDVRKIPPRTVIRMRLTLAKRYSTPPAVILFVLLAIVLSYRFSGRGREWTVPLVAVVVFGYYMLIRAGDAMAFTSVFPAIVAAWLPNLLYTIGLTLLWIRIRRPS